MEAVLSVEDLVVRARGRPQPVLGGVSLGVAPGEVLGLVGESGSGKSTLARSILRLEAPLSIEGGRIWFGGEDLVAASGRRLRALRGRRIGLVPQDPLGAFDPLFTVGSQVRAFVGAHRGAIASAARVAPNAALDATFRRIEAFGLPDPERAGRERPSAFSRGMLQRVLFALATATAPDLLVLDEPTAALDAPVADRLIADLARLAKTGGTGTILITHELSLAALAADRILVLKDGAVVETASTAQFVARPDSDYARRLVASGAW
ncbi:MAG: ATP-binding cassette domain-containing protein [Pseudomonadota bacterium]